MVGLSRAQYHPRLLHVGQGRQVGRDPTSHIPLPRVSQALKYLPLLGPEWGL